MNVSWRLQRNNQEIALFGLQYNLIQADECPCLNRDFFRRVLEEGELNWHQLPLELQNDLNFTRSISVLVDKDLPEQILSQLVEIRHDQSFWRKLLHHLGKENYLSFKHLLAKYGPAELCSDREFMLEICGECTDAFTLVERSLASDPDLLELVLGQNPAVIQFLSHETQQLHRDLVLKDITDLPRKDHRSAYRAAKALWPSFWTEYNFAMTWVKAGHGFPNGVLSHDQLMSWTHNLELCLASAIHGSKSFYDVQSHFKAEISFMQEVLTHHPELYSEAEGEAKADPVVMTTAFASMPQLVVHKMSELHLKGLDNEINEYLVFLRNRLDPFDAFAACILGNMLSTQSVDDTGTNLILLNQGLETSSNYKRVLAEYLDIPTGTWLWQLQQGRGRRH